MSDLTAHDVRHRYGQREALRGVTATLAAGEVTAIVGPNGAGKSTLLRILAGLMEPTSGEVRLGARVVAGMAPRERARHIAVVAQRPELPFAWSVLEVVLMGRAPWTAAGALESGADRELALSCLQRVGADELVARDFGELSGGEQQRVLMARALAQDTTALLLDEPTSHLDPAYALNAGSLWRALAAEGRTIGVVVHDLNLAGRFADRIVMLRGGAVAATGTPDEVLTAETVREVYGVGARRVEGATPALVFGEEGTDGAA